MGASERCIATNTPQKSLLEIAKGRLVRPFAVLRLLALTVDVIAVLEVGVLTHIAERT